MGQKNEKPPAELIGRGKQRKILVNVDNTTSISRKIKPEDAATYPDLAEGINAYFELIADPVVDPIVDTKELEAKKAAPKEKKQKKSSK